MNDSTKYRNVHTGKVESWHRDGAVMVSESGERWSVHRLDADPTIGVPASPGFHECHVIANEEVEA